MGNLKGIKFVEIREYEDTSNPQESDYTVHLPVTGMTAVYDESSGKMLYELINEIKKYLVKHNMTAVTDPTENDHENFNPGSMWFNHTKKRLWVCKNIQDEIAEWTPLTTGYGR